MPLVSAKCLECGGELQVDNSREAAVCQYCGTPFIVEKAINHYNNYNSYNFNNAEVHIHNEQSLEQKLSNAETFLSVHQDFEKAYTIFEQIANQFPNDYRGWWGMVRASTCEFQDLRVEIIEIEQNVRHARNVAPEEMRKKINAAWREYYDRCEEMRYEEAKRASERQEARERQEQENKKEYDSLVLECARLRGVCDSLRKWSKGLLAIGIFVILPTLCGYGDPYSAGVAIVCFVIAILLMVKRHKSKEKYKIMNKKLERNPFLGKDKSF